MSEFFKQQPLWVFAILILCSSHHADAQEVAKFREVTIVTSNATVTVEGSGSKREAKINPNRSESEKSVESVLLRAGETATVSGEGHADVVFSDMGTARLEDGTVISLPTAQPAEPAPDEPETKKSLPTSLKLLKGKMLINIDAEKLKKDGGKEFRLETPKSLLAVKGTRFVTAIGEGTDTTSLNEGRLAIRENETEKFAMINTKQTAEVSVGQAPQVRKISEEEAAYDSVFNKFDLEFQESYNFTRGHTTECRVSQGAPPAGGGNPYTIAKKFTTSQVIEVEGIDGPVLQMTYEPDPEHLETQKLANLKLTPKALRKRMVPVGVLLKMRSSDLDGLSISGQIGITDDELYGINQRIEFPKVPEGENDWVEVFVPAYLKFPKDEGEFENWKGAGINILLQVTGKFKPFTLEIASVKLANRPPEK